MTNTPIPIDDNTLPALQRSDPTSSSIFKPQQKSAAPAHASTHARGKVPLPQALSPSHQLIQPHSIHSPISQVQRRSSTAAQQYSTAAQQYSTAAQQYSTAAQQYSTAAPPAAHQTNMHNSDTVKLPDVTTQDIAANVKVLRESFSSGALKDISARKTVLKQLQTLMKEGEAAMKEAMWKDLHKHPTESYLAEIALVNAEIQDHLDYIDDWTKPELASTNLANLPGLSYIHRDPLGVVCVIGTWNYPVNLLFVPLIAAITAGNCALVRLPGDDTTKHLNNVLIELFEKYVDARFVRYVYGGVEETKAMLSEKYDLIFATGGCFLGKIVAKAAAETLTPTILELGGKSPVIVDDSADLALAARRIAWGAFSNAGQTCVRPDYVLVDAKVGDKFVKLLEETVHTFYGSDPKTSDGYGRVVNERSYARLHAMLDEDRKHVTFGGDSDASDKYIHPTLFNFKTDFAAFTSSAVMSQELFGPLLPIYYYGSGNLSMPIEFITSKDKPLALYHFTTNDKNKKRVIRDTTAGSMMVNDTMMQLTNPHVPFGGVGNSGMGAYHGKFGFEAFSHRKPVIHKYSVLDLPQRYAPYTPASERVLRIVQYPFSRAFFRTLKLAGYAFVLALVAIGIKKAGLDEKVLGLLKIE